MIDYFRYREGWKIIKGAVTSAFSAFRCGFGEQLKVVAESNVSYLKIQHNAKNFCTYKRDVAIRLEEFEFI